MRFVLLIIVASCLTLVEIVALSQRIDGTALIAYSGAMGAIFGAGAVTGIKFLGHRDVTPK